MWEFVFAFESRGNFIVFFRKIPIKSLVFAPHFRINKLVLPDEVQHPNAFAKSNCRRNTD